MRDASADRDLRKPKNLGEFAFATCVVGVLLLIPAVVVAVVGGNLLRDHLWGTVTRDWDVLALTALVWIPLQVPFYRSLLKYTASWREVDFHSKQLFFVELCAVCVVAAFRALALGDSTFSDVARGLKYFFSGCIVVLIIYHAAACFFLRVRPQPKEIVVWFVALLSALFAFRDIDL